MSLSVPRAAVGQGGVVAHAHGHNHRAYLSAQSALENAEGMTAFLDSLKYDANGLVTAIVQHVDTGEIQMQAFADRAGVAETLTTGKATFWSRSRKGRWCKGETSGNFINVVDVQVDCDRDSLIYLGDPIGPSCHTGEPTCYFTQVEVEGHVHDREGKNPGLTTLYNLERTIEERRVAAESAAEGDKPSWTAKLLNDPDLLCKKIREEAGELCETWENDEGKERAASEMADVLYHSMVLLNKQGVEMEDVMRVLRERFGTSGIEEKASRAKK